MRRKYVTNKANQASLTKSKYVIVACCAAIAMILGAMSVGATRSEAEPTDENPILLNENTSYDANDPSNKRKPQRSPLNGLGLKPVPANTSKPYTAPTKTGGQSKSSSLKVLLGANPIRLNIAAEATGKGLKINLNVNGGTQLPLEVVPPAVAPENPADEQQAPDDTAQTDTPPATTEQTTDETGSSTSEIVPLLTTTNIETLQ